MRRALPPHRRDELFYSKQRFGLRTYAHLLCGMDPRDCVRPARARVPQLLLAQWRRGGKRSRNKETSLDRAQHLLRVLHSLTGWFGATALVSVVVFIVRFNNSKGTNSPAALPKAALELFKSALQFTSCPVWSGLLPRFCQLVGWRISKRFRIKDCALAKRVVVLGCMYSTMHVLAQFALFVQTCDSHLERLFALDSVLAWASGYPLVWASVVVLATCRSMELARLYYYIQRVGQLMVLVLLLVHVPQITPVLAAFAALVVLDLGIAMVPSVPRLPRLRPGASPRRVLALADHRSAGQRTRGRGNQSTDPASQSGVQTLYPVPRPRRLRKPVPLPHQDPPWGLD
ncbi:hypothetical protein BASA82_000207 [Batrachochytrium salamandrivorans]|nr:hypothetical protein BASA82_000207 [Batrachochytrium salamandrivorans]